LLQQISAVISNPDSIQFEFYTGKFFTVAFRPSSHGLHFSYLSKFTMHKN